MIPLQLWQTWHSCIPPHMTDCIELLKSQHPTFKHSLYSLKECRKFIQHHFPSNVLQAYDSLIPYAYKSDLWRLCILYIHGGIYLDVKFKCIGDFRLTELLASEHYSAEITPLRISNGLMVCYANNHLLLEAIEQIVKNVSENYYGETQYDISGPSLVGSILGPYVPCKLLYHTNCYWINSRKILEPYTQYYTEQSHFTEHYKESWLSKRVYKKNILMLVAHPDDEVLFGYHDLFQGTTVVCFTNGDNPIRSAEFYAVMKATNSLGIILGYPDSLTDSWDSIKDEDFFKEIPEGLYDYIVSHNQQGEYGHVQHIRVHNIAVALAKKLKITFQEFHQISEKNDFREYLLSMYKSQKNIIDQFTIVGNSGFRKRGRGRGRGRA